MMGGICIYCGKILYDISKEVCEECEAIHKSVKEKQDE